MIQSHVNKNLSSSESADKIAAFFCDISNEFKPINLDNLPSNIKFFLKITPCVFVDTSISEDTAQCLLQHTHQSLSEDNIPTLSEYDVFSKIKMLN